MAGTIQEEILTKIQDTYVPFLKLLIPFLERSKIATSENFNKLKAIYAIFTTASPVKQVETFLDNKKKLEDWYKKAEKKKKSPDTSDTESSQEGSKKNMEITVDQVIQESTLSDEVTIIQKGDLSLKRKREEGFAESDLKKCLETNIIFEQMNVLKSVKEQLNSETEMRTKLLVSERKVSMLLRENLSKDKEIEILKSRNEEIKTNYAKRKQKYKSLKKSIADKPEEQSSAVTVEFENLSKDKEIEVLKNRNEEIEAKYAKLKEQYKHLKRSIVDIPGHPSTMVMECENKMAVIGPALTVDAYKLSCCRNKDFSKFAGDLLEVVFGQEMLGTSVLKGISGCAKAKSVLNSNQINDIQTYVANKFNISTKQVRAAIQSKLNYCHKKRKKPCGVSNRNPR